MSYIARHKAVAAAQGGLLSARVQDFEHMVEATLPGPDVSRLSAVGIHGDKRQQDLQERD